MPECPLCLGGNQTLFTKIAGKTYHRCGDCGLTFLSPGDRLDRESEKARYLLHENHPGDPEYRRFLNRLAEPLSQRLPAGAEGLDFGSGPGPTLSLMLEERGFAMNNFDPFFAPESHTLKEKYDFITCTETIEHFYNPGAELNKLNSMLKPGGLLAVMTETLGSDERFRNWHYHREPTHVCFFKKSTMAWIAEHMGLAVESPVKNVFFFIKNPAGELGSPAPPRPETLKDFPTHVRS